jgi:hypothetical protein
MRARILTPVLLACALAMTVPAPVAAQQKLVTTLSTIEQTLWKGWQAHDPAPFQKHLLDNVVNIDEGGLTVGKAAYLTGLKDHPCDVKSFSMSDWAAREVAAGVAILTYKAAQDATCDGQKRPASVLVSSVYVQKNGTWMSAAYHESPAPGGSGM